jgi:hypothetical protein
MIRSLRKTGGLFNTTINHFDDHNETEAVVISSPVMVDEDINVMLFTDNITGSAAIASSTSSTWTGGDDFDKSNCDHDDESAVAAASAAEDIPDIDEFLNGTDLDSMIDCEIFTDFSDLLLDLDGKPLEIPNEESPVIDQSDTTTTQDTSSIIPAVVTRIATTSGSQQSASGPLKRRQPTSTSMPDCSLDHSYYHLSSKRCRQQQQEEVVVFDETDESDRQHLKYLERRRKNNAASKRSREIKKNKLADMEVQVVDLEQNNDCLRRRIDRLERLTTMMKSLLVHKVAQN